MINYTCGIHEFSYLFLLIYLYSYLPKNSPPPSPKPRRFPPDSRNDPTPKDTTLFPVRTTHGRSNMLVFPFLMRTAHGRSCQLVFNLPMRNEHGRSCTFVFQILVRITHGRSCPMVFQSTSVSVSAHPYTTLSKKVAVKGRITS